MTTIGGEPCDEKRDGHRCTKNAGHASTHRFPVVVARGHTIAQAVGKVLTCGNLSETKDQAGDTIRRRCIKPQGHASNHYGAGRTWA